MSDEIKAGRIRLAPELLLDILGLSAEHRIMGVRDRGPTSDRRSVIEIVVAGPTMPLVAANEVAPEVEVVYLKRDYDLQSVERAYNPAAA